MKLINDNIITNFIKHLQNEGKSAVSIKNYKSDINHFLAWASLKLKTYGNYMESVSEIIPFISQNFFEEYKLYMTGNNVKVRSTNRRLSSLRNFSQFLYSTNAIDKDYMEGIQNAGIGVGSGVRAKSQDIISSFRESLINDQKISANTVKNYVSDVKSFIAWMNQKGELPNGL